MSVLPFVPNDEQQHLLELLFVQYPQHVELALTLLEQYEDRVFFVRPLALIARASDDFQTVAQIECFLAEYLSDEWGAVHPELDIFEDALDEEQNILSVEALKARFDRYLPQAAIYEYCMGLNHEFVRMYQHFVDDMREFGLIEEAKRCILQLQALFPEEPEYYYDYAILLGNHEDTQAQQLDFLTRAATAAKATPDYLNRLAEYYEEIIGDSQKAMHWLERSLRLSDQEPYTHFMLAERYCIKEQFEKADHHYYTAAHLSQSDGYYCAHYAWFLLEMERVDEALEWATQAVALQANVHRFDQPLAFHSCLAAVYWYGYQDADQAQEVLDEMQVDGFDDPIAERLRQDQAAGIHTLPEL